MINRSYNADRPEPLQQGSLTGIRGVDYAKPITADNVVHDMCNLTVNTDGTLSVRKPLIANREYVITVDSVKITASNVIPLYDSAYTLIVYDAGSKRYVAIEDIERNALPITFYGEHLDNTGDFVILMPTVLDNVYDVSNLFNMTGVNALNTATSTVLGNSTVDLTNINVSKYLYEPNIIDEASAKAAPRYMHVTKSDSEKAFKWTVKNPEPNTLSTGSDLILDPNLTLDSPYAIRDTYNSRYVSIDGILPYTYCENSDNPTHLPSINVDYAEKTLTDSATYSSGLAFLKNVKPPHSPVLVELVGNYNAYVDNAYVSDVITRDPFAGEKARDFHSKGGMCFIYFKKFNFKQAMTNALDIADYSDYTIKPSKVTVTYNAVLINTVKSNNGQGYSNVAYVNVDDVNDIDGGYAVTSQTPQVFEGNAINYRDGVGYYITCKEIPNVQALTKDTRVIGKAQAWFNNVSSVTYTCEDNDDYYNDTQGSPARRPKYFGYLTYNDGSKDYRHVYSYQCGNIVTRNGKRYYEYFGQGIAKLTLKITVEYTQNDKVLEYTDTVEINAFKHFNGRYGNLVTPWYDADTLVGCNFPAYIFKGSEISQNTFNTPNIRETSKTINPNLHGFTTSATVTYKFVEHADYAKYETKGTVSNTYTPNNTTLKLTIPYTLGQVVQSVTLDTTFKLNNFSSSAEVSGITTLTANGKTTKQDILLNANTVSQTFTNTWNDEYGTISASSDMTFIEGGYSYEALTGYTVQDITERKQFAKFQLTDVVNPSRTATTVLKAFMHLKDSNAVPYYGVWEYSTDGVDWRSYYVNPSEGVLDKYLKDIKIPKYTISESGSIETSSDEEPVSQACGIRFNVTSEKDITYVPLNGSGEVIASNLATYIVPNRPDVLLMQNLSPESSKIYCIDPDLPPLKTVMLRFTACTVNEDDIANILAVSFFNVDTGNWKFANTLVDNAVLGRKLYHKHAIYSFGHPSFNCNILTSDVNSFITPLSRLIDVSSSVEDTVTALIPWRDYLVAFTEHDVHLITDTENGFYTKTVTTFVGVSDKDSGTCKAILNGIVFKSGRKFYTLYPNYTSSDESILNLNEISSPINHILEALPDSEYRNFSISTSSYYYTFIPYDNRTVCIVYNYDNRVWYMYEYENVRLIGYRMDSVKNIYIYGYYNGTYTEYVFDKDIDDVHPNFKAKFKLAEFDELPYGDYLSVDSLNANDITFLPNCTPIKFKLDTGQRTDNISITKQFVETKILLATQSSKPGANISMSVFADGIPVKIRTQGTGTVYKTSPAQVLTLGDILINPTENVINTMSHAYFRYSGKGKTIRHVIEGESLYNFKLYELFYRYRIPPIKL